MVKPTKLKSKMSRAGEPLYEASSGNVFADLGFADADDRLARSELALSIARFIRARKLTQTAAAALLGIDQPKVSRLLAGKLNGFSTEQLLRFLTVLGHDVSIVVRKRRDREPGLLTVDAP